MIREEDESGVSICNGDRVASAILVNGDAIFQRIIRNL